MTRKAKAKQPRLIPALERIEDDDALNLDGLMTRYRCRCGNIVQSGIRVESVVCTRCGSEMKAI